MFINRCKTKFIHSFIQLYMAFRPCVMFVELFDDQVLWFYVFSLCLLLTFSWPDPRLEITQCKMHVLTIQARIPICFEQLMAYIGIVWIVGRKENMVTMLFTSGSFLLVMSNYFLRKDHGHYLKIPSWNVSHIVIILILWIKDFNLCLIQSFTYKMKTKTIFYILFLAV